MWPVWHIAQNYMRSNSTEYFKEFNFIILYSLQLILIVFYMLEEHINFMLLLRFLYRGFSVLYMTGQCSELRNLAVYFLFAIGRGTRPFNSIIWQRR